ncbi:DNA repair protein [Ruegeria marisrubri]|uniref:DNA repair protein n=1 Tax=Ruegeria marisrubri TaxID=1685379 RepID=A0A0X3U160_9RHOB|nr:DNA repair protein [Ruegeria marisrubri]KUJ80626.1 DNA repair protein [Ruegeria marisrubri]
MASFHQLTLQFQTVFLRLTFFLICAAALFAVTATTLSALGIWPWLTLEAGFGETAYPNAGMFAQIGLTCLVLMLAFYLPANGRIMALENTHRKFDLQMQDIVHAYQVAHAADRSGVFTLASEFDAVKERLAYLRDHPDLQGLEPEVLELASQMSQISHELATVYSDAKVERARAFLKQRQEEIELFKDRLEDAQIILHELRQWTRDVDIEESIAKAQLGRLRDELFELLPELSAQLRSPPDGDDPAAASVIAMQPPRAAE